MFENTCGPLNRVWDRAPCSEIAVVNKIRLLHWISHRTSKMNNVTYRLDNRFEDVNPQINFLVQVLLLSPLYV